MKIITEIGNTRVEQQEDKIVIKADQIILKKVNA